MDDVRSLTRDYERWVGSRIPLVAGDLARKHEEMRHDEHRFLRGTYYLWLLRAADAVPDAFSRARVPLVGDLHVENLGTWHDADGVRRWGVNDLDELARGPWLLDLVRLAVSAILSPHLTVGDHEVCDTVLAAWYDAEPGPAVDLRDRDAAHLAPLVPKFPDADRFYTALRQGAEVHDVPRAVVVAAERVAEPGWRPTWHVHEAGTGSLGHLRRAGVGPAADGSTHAREAKQLGQPTCLWAADRHPAVEMPTADPAAYAVVSAFVHGPAGAARVRDWQVRDLAPDVVRIQLAGQPHRDSRHLLAAMSRAAADVHGADAPAFRSARGESVPERDFRALVATMADVVRRDFHSYA